MTRKQVLAKLKRDAKKKINRRNRALERSLHGYEQSYARSQRKKKRATRITQTRRGHKVGLRDLREAPPATYQPEARLADDGRSGQDHQGDAGSG